MRCARPLRALFELVSGPAPTLARGASTYRGLVTCAIDGTILYAADSSAHLVRLPKHRGVRGETGYPQVRMLALVACGTRSAIGAVFGTDKVGETVYAEGLLGHLHAGMLLLADRNFASQKLIEKIAEVRAELLIRVKAGRNPPSIGRLAGGTYLARLGAVTVRVVEAEICVRTSTGRATGHYRLVTTLTDSVPDTDPDRASSTVALQASRDQLILAHAIIADKQVDLVGADGRRVLQRLQPARRQRTRQRIVKRAPSKCGARGPAIDRTTYKSTFSITVLASPD